ncbi:Uncharacterised protein g5585 [Pycnogonum litorale]
MSSFRFIILLLLTLNGQVCDGTRIVSYCCTGTTPVTATVNNVVWTTINCGCRFNAAATHLFFRRISGIRATSNARVVDLTCPSRLGAALRTVSTTVMIQGGQPLNCLTSTLAATRTTCNIPPALNIATTPVTDAAQIACLRGLCRKISTIVGQAGVCPDSACYAYYFCF